MLTIKHNKFSENNMLKTMLTTAPFLNLIIFLFYPGILKFFSEISMYERQLDMI